MTYSKLFDTIIALLEGYGTVRRKNTQPINQRLLQDIGQPYDPDQYLVRESLIEHVGCLPILATTIFPYIEDPRVDLGEALTMLAIHDIGELDVGDEIGFTKNETKHESKAAIARLHPLYHNYYHDIELQTSPSGKFAKSIDKIAPEFLDIMCGVDITIQRYAQHMGIGPNEIMPLKLSHKRKYMERNLYILGFFEYVCERFDEILR